MELQDIHTYKDDTGSPNSDKEASPGAMVDIGLESSVRENVTASAQNAVRNQSQLVGSHRSNL